MNPKLQRSFPRVGLYKLSADIKRKGCFMKNLVKIFGFIAIVAIIGFTVIACGGGGGSKLSGVYSDEKGTMTFTFSGNKLTSEAFGQKGEGTYKIEGDKLLTTGPDGKTETWDIKIEGDTITMGQSGFNFTLKKK